jgi:hypothetical protein
MADTWEQRRARIDQKYRRFQRRVIWATVIIGLVLAAGVFAAVMAMPAELWEGCR